MQFVEDFAGGPSHVIASSGHESSDGSGKEEDEDEVLDAQQV